MHVTHNSSLSSLQLRYTVSEWKLISEHGSFYVLTSSPEYIRNEVIFFDTV